MIFDHLNNLLHKKSNAAETVNSDPDFVPYMVQRWCSMYSPEIANLLNQTSNRHWSVLDSKEMWYEYLDSTLPQCRYKRIAYIKKVKDTEKVADNKEMIQKVADNLEISAREVSLYIDQFGLQLPHEQNQSKKARTSSKASP